MKLLRPRLWLLMGLVLAVALGIKAVLVVQARRDPFEYRFPGQWRFVLPPRTPAMVAALKAALHDSDPGVRWYGLWALDSFGSTAPELVPPLINHLETETRQARRENRRMPDQVDPARSLKRFGLPASVLAPRLKTAMASPDDLIRSRAVSVLADAANRAGNPSDPTLVALLLSALDDANPENRLTAAGALARLDGVARRRAVALLLGQIRGSDRIWGLLATVNLARFDPEGAAAASLLADRLDIEDGESRVLDLYLLGRLGPMARPAVPAIVRAMLASDSQKPAFFPFQRLIPRQNSGYSWDNLGVLPMEDRDFQRPGDPGAMGAVTLSRLGPAAERQAVAILIGMLGEEDEARRIAGAVALGHLGTRASAAFPALLVLAEAEPSGFLLKGRQPSEQYIYALRRVTPGDDPRLVAALIRFLESDYQFKRLTAASVLSSIDPPAPAAIPALIGALRSDWQSIRGSAARALGRCTGPEAEAAVAPLVANLSDPDDYARFHTAKALSQLHAGALEVVPVALAFLQNKNLAYRRGAVEILGVCGPAAGAAIPALRALRSAPDVFLRHSVEKALLLIEPVGATPAQ